MWPGKIAAACAACISLTASGLELGELQLKSASNQLFHGEIALTDIAGVAVGDISPDFVQRDGDYWSKIKLQKSLQLQVRDRQDGTYAIDITASRPLTQSVINFTVQLVWPGGRTSRQYTVRSGQASGAGRSASVEKGNEYGQVAKGDTLWSIAVDVASSLDVSAEQAVLALQRANPDAFDGNNINGLKAGYALQVPELAEFLKVSPVAAVAEVRRQNWENADFDITDVRAITDRAAPGTSLLLKEPVREPVRKLIQEPETQPTVPRTDDKDELTVTDSPLVRPPQALETASLKDETSGLEWLLTWSQLDSLDIKALQQRFPVLNNPLLAIGVGILVILVIISLMKGRRKRRRVSGVTRRATGAARAGNAAQVRAGNVAQVRPMNVNSGSPRPAVTAAPEVTPAVDNAVADDVSDLPGETPSAGKNTDLDPEGDGHPTSSKVDLARAYMEMGDKEGALRLLRAVLAKGTISEVAEANELLKKLS